MANVDKIKKLQDFLRLLILHKCISIRDLDATTIELAEQLVIRRLIDKTSTKTNSYYHLPGDNCNLDH